MAKKYYFIVYSLLFLITALPSVTQNNPSILTVGNLPVITPENAGKLAILSSLEADTKHVSVSPDGKILAIVNQHLDFDFTISIIDLNTNEERSYMQGRMDFFRDLVWSPDSQQIAVTSDRLTGGGVQIQSVKTYTIEKGSTRDFYILGYSDRWYTNDFNVGTLDPAGEEISHTRVAWNPESHMISVAFHDLLNVYDINTDVQLFSTQVTDISNVAWSADGKLIITESPSATQVWGVS